MSFDVTAGPRRPDTIRMPNYRYESVVHTAASRTLVPTGSAVHLSGTVAFRGRPVHYPTVAVYEQEGGAGLSLLAVVHGTAFGNVHPARDRRSHHGLRRRAVPRVRPWAGGAAVRRATPFACELGTCRRSGSLRRRWRCRGTERGSSA